MIEILDCAQGSDEWHAARLGLPTASGFRSIMAAGRERRTRMGYLHRLAAEILTGEMQPINVNDDMRRGKEQEPEARDAYGWLYEVEPREIGFVFDDELRIGCSPDALIGEDGLIEIKCRRPSGMVEVMVSGGVPSEYRAQIQGNLWITGRQWCDLVCYHRDMPLYVAREERHEDYIATLAAEVLKFRAELDELVRSIGSPKPALRDMLERSVA